MRALFSTILILLLGSTTADSQTAVNLAMRRKLEEKNNYTEKMFVLLKGNVKSIKNFVDSNNGRVIGSAGDIVSAEISIGGIARLINQPFVEVIGSDVYQNRPMNDTMRLLTRVDEVHAGQAPLAQSYKGRNVILGIIDSGIDYNHPDFRDSLGHSRVQWLWDMTLAGNGQSPAQYNYGREFTHQQIDSGLAPADTMPGLYGHGTYVAGIAAGNGTAVGHFTGVAPEADLVVVAFNFSANDTVSRYAHAIEYIFSKAQQAGKPCVINASLGDYYGSHDGLDLQSQYIRYLINQQPGRVLVAAAGNIGINFPFHVGRNSVAGDTVFTWFKYNAGYGGAYIQVFADTADFRNVRFSIGADKVNPYYNFRGATPFTNVFASLNNPVNQSIIVNGKRLCQLQTYSTRNGGVYSIEVYVIPDSLPSDYNWRFSTTGTGHYDSWTFDWAWQGLPADSVFSDIIKYYPPDTMQSIVSGMACLDNVITVGNYYNTDRHLDYDSVLQITANDRPRYLAENSSRGPTRDGRIKPEITAPGHHIISAGVLSQLPGLIAAQPYKVAPGGFHITGGGTSASAPVVAGLAALYLEENPGADWSSVKQAILNCASTDTFTWGPFPNNAWGYGKADAFATLTTCAATVGTIELNNFPINVYPNPAHDQLILDMNDNFPAMIKFTDISGRLISEKIVTVRISSILVEDFQSGIYLMSISLRDSFSIIKKIIISR